MSELPDNGRLPETPKLVPAPLDEAVPMAKAAPVMPTAVPITNVGPPAVVDTEARYWTEDRIIRLGLMLLFAIMVIGLVIALWRWPVLADVPWVPWLVGAGVLAGPAWKAYEAYAEEASGKRARAEHRAHGFGVRVPTPTDRRSG